MDDTISYELAMLPGMTQLLCLLKIEESVRSREYDAIILDMPASGEALRTAGSRLASAIAIDTS